MVRKAPRNPVQQSISISDIISKRKWFEGTDIMGQREHILKKRTRKERTRGMCVRFICLSIIHPSIHHRVKENPITGVLVLDHINKFPFVLSRAPSLSLGRALTGTRRVRRGSLAPSGQPLLHAYLRAKRPCAK